MTDEDKALFKEALMMGITVEELKALNKAKLEAYSLFVRDNIRKEDQEDAISAWKLNITL